MDSKMNLSFIDTVKYKKERVGLVEKNGKTCVKYRNVSRFRIGNNIKYIVLIVFILAVLGVGIKLLLSEMASRPSTDETQEEADRRING